MTDYTRNVSGNKRGNPLDPEDTFTSRVEERADGCIAWVGTINDSGYGLMPFYGRQIRAHRYAWERENGPIPEGMVIDHLCWNRACVNVEHLRVITMAQNQQNREGANKRSKNGVRGISWDERTKKWRVRVFAKGKCHWGGRFVDKDEAAKVAANMRARLQPYSQN